MQAGGQKLKRVRERLYSGPGERETSLLAARSLKIAEFAGALTALSELGLDLRRTTHLSRFIELWGQHSFSLSGDTDDNRYVFVGSEDWAMYPLIQPGSVVLLDETRRNIVNSECVGELERPIYFLEHQRGYACGWCSFNGNQLVVQSHPASMYFPEVYVYPDEIDVIGQIAFLARPLARSVSLLHHSNANHSRNSEVPTSPAGAGFRRAHDIVK